MKRTLLLTTAALIVIVVGARRTHPERAWLYYAPQLALEVAGLVEYQAHRHPVSRRRAGHEHHAAVGPMAHPVTAGCNSFDGDYGFGLRVGHRNDSFRAAWSHAFLARHPSAPTAGTLLPRA